MAHVQKIVAFGPRPSGSPELELTRKYIEENLRACGWLAIRDPFNAPTPRGPVEFVNLVARFAGEAGTQQAIVASHYDTKIFSTIQFLGANDGGSSTGALLELARVLALDPALARRVELVFFDGEEAVSQFSETDGLYGSRNYAAKMRASGRAGQFRFGVVWDMIGDRELTITLPPDSPGELARGIFASADALGARSRFTYFDRAITDDHTPLNAIGIPTIDLIDFRFDYWHTADDTPDKLSAESLRTIGAVTLHRLRQAIK